MKFTGVAVLAIAATTVGAFAPSAVHQRSATTLYSTAEEKSVSKKDGRLSFMKSDKFHRKGFKEVREGVEETINSQFQSSLVDEFKASNYMLDKGGVKVYLAKDFGFCWGVERSIALAYEAVEHYPGKKLHITNELIHNPEVNDKLTDMKVNMIEKLGDGKKQFDVVEDGDVVILPAFGASFEEMELLDKKVRLYPKLQFDTASGYCKLIPQVDTAS
jgi:4-hydroxy-3-methylbut-2-enyl diphosphate reductase